MAATTVTVVGFSGSVAGPDAACSCYLIERDGFRLVADLGSGSIGPLQRVTDVTTLDMVFISHAHQDHWIDLNQLAYLRHRAGSAPLTVVAPADLPLEIDFAGDLHVAPAREGSFRAGPLTLTLSALEHTDHTWGLRVDDGGCYTADTAACPALDALADGCHTLLAEASALDGEAHPGHLSAGDAGRLSARSRSRLLVLTHLRPWRDVASLLDEATTFATCPVVSAATGLRFTV